MHLLVGQTCSPCRARTLDPAAGMLANLRTSGHLKNDNEFEREVAYQNQVQHALKKGAVQHSLTKAPGEPSTAQYTSVADCCHDQHHVSAKKQDEGSLACTPASRHCRQISCAMCHAHAALHFNVLLNLCMLIPPKVK